jgi:hypothetical protein
LYIHKGGIHLEHNVVKEKGINSKTYLRALKRDFDTIWRLYGNASDDELKNENEVKVKHQMVAILEDFFHGD